MFGMMDGLFGYGGAMQSFADHRVQIVGDIDGFGIAVIVLSLILWATLMTALVLSIMELLRRRKAPRSGPPDLPGQGSPRPGVSPASPSPGAPVAVPGPEASSTSATSVAGSPEVLRILDERYARGEMSREEYFQRKSDLLGAGTRPEASV